MAGASTRATPVRKRPRATRLVASVFAALTAADFLQFAYAAAEKTESS